MTKRMIYIAKDGKEFNCEVDCLEYEEKCREREKENLEIKKAAEIIQHYCKSRDCNSCFFRKENIACVIEQFSPYDWKL